MASLNPRHTIRRIVTEPLLFHRVASRRERARSGVRARSSSASACPPRVSRRYPHELSGGQRQRVGIARAALLAPDFVLADEIVSGLDVSTQAQALNLLKDLSRDLGLAMAFISHDLSVIRAVCDRVYVLRHGRRRGRDAATRCSRRRSHEYTRALLDAIPLPRIDPGWLRRNTAADGAENGSVRLRSSSSASV